MENASKALIIAGSILIAILLISLGLLIFNSSNGMNDKAKETSDIMEMAAFNAKFTPYAGENKTADDAINMINIIRASNSSSSRKVALMRRYAYNDNGPYVANEVNSVMKLVMKIGFHGYWISSYDSIIKYFSKNELYNIELIYCDKEIEGDTAAEKYNWKEGYISGVYIYAVGK